MFRYGITNRADLWRLKTERELGARVLAFVGDLDPLDLAAFASLAAGARTHGLKLVHVGVDDRWVELCRRYLKSPTPGHVPTIRMSPFEMATLQSLRELPGAVPPGVGATCEAILETGQKLETEGASNPVFYREGFAEALRRMLRRQLTKAAVRGRRWLRTPRGFTSRGAKLSDILSDER